MIAALLVGACAPPPTPDTLEVRSFEQTFTRVRETCPDPGLYGADWQGAHDELLPQAVAATSPEALRPVLTDLLGRLNASHYRVIPGQREAIPGWPTARASLPGATGLRLRRLDDRVVATAAEGPATGVALGWALRSVGDASVDALVALVDRQFEPRDRPGWLLAGLDALLNGEEGQSLDLAFEDGEGSSHAFTLVLGAPPGSVSQVGYGVAVQVVTRSRVLAGNVGYFAFNAFYAPVTDRFTEAMQSFLAVPVRGLVLDLRGNEGGVVGLARGVAGWLFDRPVSLGTLTYRAGPLELNVSPRPQPFTGPVAVLVDELTASTAEIFAASLQGLGRARVFGSLTAQAALPSVFEALPDGDVLQLAVADYRGPTGARVEGAGVRPDELVPLRREVLLQGTDPALAAALSWLESAP